jgi:uncharacterized protein
VIQANLIKSARRVRGIFITLRANCPDPVNFNRFREALMSKRSLTFAGVLVFILLVAAPATAQQPSQTEEMAAARELIATMKITDQFKAILPAIMKNMATAMLVGRSPEFVRDFEAVQPKLVAALQDRSSQVNDVLATVYASNFSLQELQDMIAFYRTSTGQKVVERLPSVAQQSMQAGQLWGKQVAAEIRQQLIEELRKKGHDI